MLFTTLFFSTEIVFIFKTMYLHNFYLEQLTNKSAVREDIGALDPSSVKKELPGNCFLNARIHTAYRDPSRSLLFSGLQLLLRISLQCRFFQLSCSTNDELPAGPGFVHIPGSIREL